MGARAGSLAARRATEFARDDDHAYRICVMSIPLGHDFWQSARWTGGVRVQQREFELVFGNSFEVTRKLMHTRLCEKSCQSIFLQLKLMIFC